ncbi:hypothetical protein Q0812_10535 [Brevundimonas sp. 2R-24]|uniref:Uncharacterized protein n=1 Tax=Peiella sedimenti TaxID=3061083 RepID=A0ABT8SNB1_9CAUL|nr:hypothetical protein [Caulobacteraceae bacterium XZ-24]
MRLSTSMIPLALAALGAVGPSMAQSGLPTYAEQGLRWVREPSLREMQRLYGVNARWDLPRVTVEVSCTPTANGRLNCSVLNADDLDRRWVRAGEQLMESATVASVDGGSPEGRTFGFTLRWGNTTARHLPDRFHPLDQNLRWVRRPEMGQHWDMRGQRPDQIYTANFSCIARVSGTLNCQMTGLGGGAPRAFGQAAGQAMAQARVERADGGSPEGMRLNWTVAIQRQSSCGGGATSGYGRFASGDDQNRGNVYTNGGDGGSFAGPTQQAVGKSGQLPGYIVGGDPVCQPVMLTVNTAQGAGPSTEASSR